MERWAFRAALAVVVLAPLALGANRPWAWQALAAVFAVLCFVPQSGRARVPRGAAVLWLAALAWAAVQVFGLAPPVRPDLWAQAAEALGQPVPARAVLDADAAAAGLLRLLTWTVAFWLFLHWATSRRRAAVVVAAIGWAGVAWAAVALALLAAGDRLPFGEKVQHLGFATGPFPNRNTLALWLGMAACALAAAGVQRGVWRSVRRGWAWWLGAATLAAALAATQSRAGLVVAAVGLAVAVARLARPGWALAAVLAGGMLLVATPVSLRLAATALDPAAEPRLVVWATTLEGIARAPWTGIGLGAFPAAFAEVRPRALLQPWRYAHNSYLELAWELGVPTAVAVVAALAGIGWRLLRTGSTTAAAGLGALVAAGLHALVDFSPQVPAAALLLAVLLGSGCGRAGAVPRHPVPSADPPPRPAPPDPAPGPVPPG
ncbi:O-antigen ligase family protein [Caenispirillum bisanense]|uniref:O-antigen ligase n=1 Tax=Caenispirillum bisanense TaxID=414052 RepID=A0A286GNT8_9PROT|nr:O-antigen ligase family protein [Caenispirillum bisanense]SOD97203.1 O-antigen ligase [Caenispirillum bisanense]